MNIRKMLPIMIGILTVVMTASATSLYAQQRERGRFGGPGFMQGRGGHGMMSGVEMGPMRLVRLAERLDLTKEQRNSIGRIMDDTRPKLRDNMFKLMDARKAMRELLNGKGKVEDRKLRSLTREQADAMGEMTYLRLKMHNDIRNVLTKEQLAKLDKFRGQRRWMRTDRLRDRRDQRGRWFRNWRGQPPSPAQENPQQG